MSQSDRRVQTRWNLQARFALLMVLAGAGAFLVGTRFVAPPDRSTHTVTGRPIPGTTTDAAWMDRRDREREEKPDRALASIPITSGMSVADIGAGTGYMTVRLASVVGPAGTVYANDIQPEMLRHVEQRVREQQLTNVRLVQGTPDDARLPVETVDVALLVNVYHELRHPQAMLQSIRRSLKTDGRLVLVEYRLEDPTVPIAATHRMSVAMLRTEIEPEGFVFERTTEELPSQHIVIFRKAATT